MRPGAAPCQHEPPLHEGNMKIGNQENLGVKFKTPTPTPDSNNPGPVRQTPKSYGRNSDVKNPNQKNSPQEVHESLPRRLMSRSLPDRHLRLACDWRVGPRDDVTCLSQHPPRRILAVDRVLGICQYDTSHRQTEKVYPWTSVAFWQWARMREMYLGS